MATLRHQPFILTPVDNVMPRSHVPTLLFFPESPGTNVSTMVDTLRDGLSKTLNAIEPLSGTIQAYGQQGGLCVNAPWNNVNDIFHVKDMTHEERLEHQKLKDNDFPVQDLDIRLLFPMEIFTKIENAVMYVELIIIKGGLITVLCLHHSFTDGNGTVAITNAWAAFCRGDDSSQWVRPEMMDRHQLMRGLGSASLADFPELMPKPVDKKAPSPNTLTHIFTSVLSWITARLRLWTTGTQGPDVNAATFFFSKKKLAELKVMASAGDRGKEGDEWVSTNDALCALMGCCVPLANGGCKVGLVVGGRRLLNPPLPADYVGNIMTFIEASVPNQNTDSMKAKVALLAHLIRSQIRQRDERYITRMISALSSVEDFAKVIVRQPAADRIGISSWGNQGFYDTNWGDAVGAGIESVRIWFKTKNLCVILPELSAPRFTGDQCGLEVVIGLEKRHIERLKKNELFMRFAEWRGN